MYIIIPFISAVCNLFLLLTFISAKKDKLIRSFMWLLVSFTTWTLGSFFMRIGLYPNEYVWFHVSMTSIIAVPVMIYGFLHHYTNRRGTFKLTVFRLGTILMAVLNLKNVFISNPRIVVSENGTHGFTFDITWATYILVVFAGIVLYNSGKLIYISIKKDGFPITTFRPFLIGIGVMVLAMALDCVPGLSEVFPVDPFACMINAILIYFMLYKKRVFKMTQLASSSSNYFISTLLTAMVLTFFYQRIDIIFNTHFSAYKEYQTLITSILFSFLTILVFNLLRRLTNNLFVKNEQLKEALLKDFSLSISKTLDCSEILSLYTELINEHTSIDTAYVFVYDSTEQAYMLQSCTDKMKAKAVSILADNPLIKWLLAHGTGISYKDFRHTSNYKSMWGTEKTIFDSLKAEHILPIICDNELIGLVIVSAKPGKSDYTYSEIAFLESVSSMVSIAMKNAELYETIQKEAHMDSLTDLYNRRYFTEKFEKLFDDNIHSSVTLILINFDDFKLYNELYGSNGGDNVLIIFADILKRVIGSRGIIGRYSGKEFSICLPMCSSYEAELIVNVIREQLNAALTESCESTKKFLTFSAGICSYPAAASNAKQLITYANMAVSAVKKRGKNKTIIYSNQDSTDYNRLSFENMEAIGQEYAPTIYALAAAVDAKDHYTFSHSENVSTLATQLAMAIGLDAEHVEMIRQAGLLHDIGKISIPEAILTKTARLTNEEYTIMKTHVENSIAMIRHLPSLDYVIPIATSHHERYDGKGYPRGLAGEEIPVGGRCLGVADAFDAMVSRRPYKDPMPIPDALNEIERNLGKQFDPVLGRTFIDLIVSGQINLDFYEKQDAGRF